MDHLRRDDCPKADYDAMLYLVSQDHRIPPYINFMIGGLSGVIGQTATHPMDVIKLRMQISHISVSNAIQTTLKDSGIRGFYLGWSAAFLRQLSYTTTRLGLYNTLYDLAQEYFGHINYPTMFSIGVMSGIMGSLVGTPADLVFVRMIGDLKLPPEKRQNYRNAIVALIDITKTEGIRGLWRGAVPTMTRAAIVNGTQLSTYSQSKMLLKDTGMFEDGILLSFSAAMVSGLAMAISSLPVDVAKTRIQNWSGPSKPPGISIMLVNVAKNEGITSLWRGFLPYYCRAAPNAVVTMICLDYFKHMYTVYFPST